MRNHVDVLTLARLAAPAGADCAGRESVGFLVGELTTSLCSFVYLWKTFKF